MKDKLKRSIENKLRLYLKGEALGCAVEMLGQIDASNKSCNEVLASSLAYGLYQQWLIDTDRPTMAEEGYLVDTLKHEGKIKQVSWRAANIATGWNLIPIWTRLIDRFKDLVTRRNDGKVRRNLALAADSFVTNHA